MWKKCRIFWFLHYPTLASNQCCHVISRNLWNIRWKGSRKLITSIFNTLKTKESFQSESFKSFFLSICCRREKLFSFPSLLSPLSLSLSLFLISCWILPVNEAIFFSKTPKIFLYFVHYSWHFIRPLWVLFLNFNINIFYLTSKIFCVVEGVTPSILRRNFLENILIRTLLSEFDKKAKSKKIILKFLYFYKFCFWN